jgi:oligo-1,6-glucosidase/alpha-glucosidase
MLHAIYEDEQFRDDSFSWKFLPSDDTIASLFRAHKYDLNLPETYDFVLELRGVINEYQPERILIGEVFGSLDEVKKYYGPENNGLNMVFLFEFTSAAFKPVKYAEIIGRIERALPSPCTPTYVLSNHDRVRFISRLKGNQDQSKIAATMQLTLRGVPIIYYGEEIGMPNSEFDLSTSQDPIGRKYSWAPNFLCKILGLTLTRDGCRTPMQWDDSPNAGFSVNPDVKPWLKVSNIYKEINVAREIEDPYSLLNCYKRLIRLRKENTALRSGALELLESGTNKSKCLAYCRTDEKQTVFVYLNFSQEVLKLKSPVIRPTILFSTAVDRTVLEPDISDNTFSLTPYEGIIFKEQN